MAKKIKTHAYHYVTLLFYTFPPRCKKYNTLFFDILLVQYSANRHKKQNKTLVM